jgi:hypothetical protein
MFKTSQPHRSAKVRYSRITAAYSFDGTKYLVNAEPESSGTAGIELFVGKDSHRQDLNASILRV